MGTGTSNSKRANEERERRSNDKNTTSAKIVIKLETSVNLNGHSQLYQTFSLGILCI